MILPHNFGSWRQACAVKAEKLVVAPREIEPIQAAMLKVNPITAWRMLHDFVPLQRGDWFIQNAANSAAGRAAIQIGHELGLKSINLVRREELIDELRSEGADVVLVDNETVRDRVAEVTGGAPIRLALNCVGGESAVRMAKVLAPDSTVVTYGAMSLQAMKIPNGLLIFKNLNFRGMWVNKWYDGATPDRATRNLCAAIRHGEARPAADESGAGVSVARSEDSRRPRDARQTRRQDRVRSPRVSFGRLRTSC